MFLPYFFSFELGAYGAQYLNYSANLPYSHLVVALFISVLSVFILFHSQYHIFLCKRNTKMVMGRCPFSASEKIEENKGKKSTKTQSISIFSSSISSYKRNDTFVAIQATHVKPFFGTSVC